MNAAEYARYRGVSQEAVRRALETGRIRACGTEIEVEEADAMWRENTDPGKAKGPSRTTSPTAGAAAYRAEKLKWEAKTAQATYEERLGKLVSVEERGKLGFTEGRKARDRVLAVAERLSKDLTPAQYQRLREELRLACEGISGGKG